MAAGACLQSRDGKGLRVCECVLISMTCPFSRWGSREMAGGAARPWRTGSGEISLSLSPNSQSEAWQVAVVGIPHSPLWILVYMQTDSKKKKKKRIAEGDLPCK